MKILIVGSGPELAKIAADMGKLQQLEGVTEVSVTGSNDELRSIDPKIAKLLEANTGADELTVRANSASQERIAAAVAEVTKAAAEQDDRTEFQKLEGLSTRGRRVGDWVILADKGKEPRIGQIIEVVNGHEVVQFVDADTRMVFVGATMDKLHPTDAPERGQTVDEGTNRGDTVQAFNKPPEASSQDFRVNPTDVARRFADDSHELVEVVLVGITTEGAVRIAASGSSGMTLNMLAQGIKVCDGTYDFEEDANRPGGLDDPKD